MSKIWTEGEVDFIRAHYADKGPRWVSERMDRTYKAIKMMGNMKLGLKYVRTCAEVVRAVTLDDVPHKTVDYAGIGITWTVGEWRRLNELTSGSVSGDNRSRRFGA